MAPFLAAPTNIAQTIGAAITVKLNQDNFLLWRAQALPALYSLDLFGSVDGSSAAPSKKVPASEGSSETVNNLEYAVWFKPDQQVLSALLASLNPSVLGHVMLLKSSASVWDVLTRMFSSRSKAKIVQLRTKLVKSKKREMSLADYYNHVKKIADTMATVGNPLSDSEIISYILAGTSEDHENFTTSISVIASKGDDDFTLNNLYGHMVVYEARNGDRVSNGSPQFQHFANNASRGGGRGGFSAWRRRPWTRGRRPQLWRRSELQQWRRLWWGRLWRSPRRRQLRARQWPRRKTWTRRQIHVPDLWCLWTRCPPLLLSLQPRHSTRDVESRRQLLQLQRHF